MFDFYETIAAVKRIIGEHSKFGDIQNGNFTGFEDDGTMVANGEATTYDDALGNLLGQIVESPSSDIIQNLPEGTLSFKTSATTADYVLINTQLTHRWKFGSSLHPHLHWIQSQAEMPNWLIQYRWQKNGQAKTTSWTPLAYSSNAFTYTTGDFNQITDFPEIVPPVGYSLSDIVQIRLIRDGNNDSGLFTGTDPYTVSAEALYFDIHVETDTLGSREEYVK